MITFGNNTFRCLFLGGAAIVLLTSYQGENTGSLRGAASSSSTKTLDLRTAARRALLKTFVYANRVYHRRRLENTMMDCSKMETITQDMMGCAYPEHKRPGAPPFLEEASGEQVGCLAGVMVGDGVLAEGHNMIQTMKDNSAIVHADPVTYPVDAADKYREDLVTLCRAKYGPNIDMANLDAAVVADEPMNQAEYHELVLQYYDANVMPDCREATTGRFDDNGSLNDDCAYMRAAVDIAFVSMDLGDNSCVDDPNWRGKFDRSHNCDFVSASPNQRCGWENKDHILAKDACCAACVDVESDN